MDLKNEKKKRKSIWNKKNYEVKGENDSMKMIQWIANTVKPDEWRKMIGMIMCLWYFDDDGNEDCLKLLGQGFYER